MIGWAIAMGDRWCNSYLKQKKIFLWFLNDETEDKLYDE